MYDCMCFSLCWQRGLLSIGRSECVTSTAHYHSTQTGLLSLCLTLQLFSFLFPFSASPSLSLSLFHHLSLSSSCSLSPSFACQACQSLPLSVWASAQNANRAISESLRGDERWTEKLNNRLRKSEYKQTNMTTPPWCARGEGDMCVCVCLWRECIRRTRQKSAKAAQICIEPESFWAICSLGSKVLLCNGKKSAQMC